MTTEEILIKLNKYKNAHDAESDPDVKAKFKSKMESLQKELDSAQAVVEKKEEKVEKAEEKKMTEVEEKLKKYKAAVAAESDPDLKQRFQKKVDALESQIKEHKVEIKEEKKEIAEQKAEIKDAVKKVTSATKSASKAETKKVVKEAVGKVKKREKITKKKSARNTELEKMIGELDVLIEKNKKLSGYKGKNVDLKRDAARPAKPVGYRFTGKHNYRVPTPEQIRKGKKRGTIDYENRANRADVFPKGVSKRNLAKLEDGGDISEFKKGGTVKRPAANIKKDAQREAKPMGWRWKNEAVKDGIIAKSNLFSTPSAKSREKFPEYVYQEERPTKADKKPSKRYTSL